LLGPNDDADAIATLACRILADRDFRVRAATAGPAFVRHRFNMDRMLDETIALYGLSEQSSIWRSSADEAFDGKQKLSN
jgi:hypothetical protein